jgi:hypothetical protein
MEKVMRKSVVVNDDGDEAIDPNFTNNQVVRYLTIKIK